MPLVYDDSIDNVQNQPGTALAVTASSTSSVYVVGSLTVSQSNWPAGTVTVSQSNVPSGVVTVTASLASPVSVAISGALNAVFSGTQTVTASAAAPVYVTGVLTTTTSGTSTITGSVGVWNVVTVSQSNAPAGTQTVTGTVHIDNDPLIVLVTGNMSASFNGVMSATLVNSTASVSQAGTWSVTVSQSNVPAGTVTTSQSNVPAGTVTVSQSNVPAGTATVTASLANPVTVVVSGNMSASFNGVISATLVNSTASVTGSVGVWNTVAVSQSNVPAGVVTVTSTFDNPLVMFNPSVGLNGASTPSWAVLVGGNNGGTFTPVAVNAGGQFSISQSNTPEGTQTVTGTVGVWNALTGTVGVWNTVTVSQSNIPAGVQTVTGTLSTIASTNTSSTLITGGSQRAVFATIGTPVVFFRFSSAFTATFTAYTSFDGATLGQALQIYTSPNWIGSSVSNPDGTKDYSIANSVGAPYVILYSTAWSSGSGLISFWGGDSTTLPLQQYPGSTSNLQGVLVGGVDVSNYFRPIAVDSFGVVSVGDGGSTLTVDGQVSVSSINSPVSVTNSSGNPVLITGTAGVWNTVAVSQTNIPAGIITVSGNYNIGINGTVVVSQALQPAGTVTTSQSNWPAGATVTGTVGVWNSVSVSQSNTPAGTQTVTGTVHVDNTSAAIKGASTAAVATDPAVVVAVSPNNTVAVSQSNTPAGTQTVSGNFNVGINGTPSVIPIPNTAGGCSLTGVLSPSTVTQVVVKASAGQVYGWYIYNTGSSTRHAKFYNSTSATIGTTVPVIRLPIPPGGGTNVWFNQGLIFGTGISYIVTSGVLDTDATAVSANEVVSNIFYK